MCRCAGFESFVSMNQLRPGMHETLASHAPSPASTGMPPEPGSARIPEALVRRLVSRIATSHGAREAIPVRAPFTGETLAEIPRCTVGDVDEAMRRARRAQAEWSGRSHAARRGIFLRFHDLLLERQEEVLDLIQLEAGKARRHAFEEVMDTAVVTRHYAYRAATTSAPAPARGAPVAHVHAGIPPPGGRRRLHRPWNYPLNLGITDASPRCSPGMPSCSSRIIRPRSPRSGPSIS
jgi:succinate-semialdehyde dehydrogenase / glutarate-semialdehyde dehydrogenase